MADSQKQFDVARKRYDASLTARRQVEQRWAIAENFLAGEHYVRWDERRATVLPPTQVPTWRPRLIINKVLNFYRTEHGRLVTSRPSFECAPGSPDLKDLMSAKYCSKAIKHWDRALGLASVDSMLKASLICHGKAFLKARWDPRGRDELGRQVGEIDVREVPCWDISIWPSTARSIKEALWVFHSTRITVGELKERFGEQAVKGLKADQGARANAGFARRLLMKFGANRGESGGTPDDESVTVVEAWAWPTQRFPNGVWMIWVGKRLLHGPAGIPYKHRRIPIRDFTYTLLPGTFWAEGLIYPLALLNARYNRTASQTMDLINRIVSGEKWMLPVGCGISPEQITSDPAEKISYTAMRDMSGKEIRPWRIESPKLPAGIFEYLRSCAADMDDAASQREVSHGRTPRNIESGVAVRSLQEADVIPLGPTTMGLEEGWREIYNQMLGLAQQFYTEPRLLKWFGSAGELEVHEAFSKRDIRPNVDVVVRAGTGAPRSKSEQRREIEDLVLAQIISPFEARNILEYQNLVPYDADYAIDVGAANRENNMMLRGVPALVHSYDEHDRHIITHNRFRKMPMFETADPQVQQIFEMHVQGHQMALAAFAPQPTEEEGSEQQAPQPVGVGA